MEEMIFQTEHLTKTYKSCTALSDVTLSIPRGSIYGLIGENGAGKTTLIRLLCGLTRPTAGTMALFGEQSFKRQTSQRKRLGCLVESPALYPDMTAVQNLNVQRLQRGIPGKGCIQKALALSGLPDTGRKRVRDFSLGMRQRLALASALLGDPEFLVLDEPLNGLDPMGIVELRRLLLSLNRERNLTILISSHILKELYQLATHYAILHHGRLLEELTLEQLQERCRKYFSIKVTEPGIAVTVLEETLGVKSYEVLGEEIRLYDCLDRTEAVLSALSRTSAGIREASLQGEDLETYFTSLIGRAKR